MDIKTRIIDYMRKKPGVTYVEIEHIFDEHGFDWKGHHVMCSEINQNVIFWDGWNEEACNIMNELQYENKIKKHVSNSLNYMIDGKVMNLPIVKSDHEYKTERWLPIEFTAL